MYLCRVVVENFRIFGDKASGNFLDLPLTRGLTLVVGENDSGKSSLLDAIRLVLGTTSNDTNRLSSDDFHVDKTSRSRATDLRITCEFTDFDDEEAAALLEWLTIEKAPSANVYKLYVTLEAQRKEVRARFDREIRVSVRTGPDDSNGTLDGAAREIIRATYLKALRDAEQELAAKRGSRLSQILMAHPLMQVQARGSAEAHEGDAVASDATTSTERQPNEVEVEGKQKAKEQSLVSIVKNANDAITAHSSIRSTVIDLNHKYLSKFTLGEDLLRGEVGISDPELKRILEQLQLALLDDSETQTRHGLGLNNLLFIATELLLLETGANGSVPLALIEEPEAHLHPQLQLRLMEALQDARSQVIVTTHSPSLASVIDLERLVIMHKGRAFPMASKYTKLDQSDYEFLRRFLDVTKANLFFARGVLIVEGDAEQLLLPVIAELLGLSFSRFGVSVVNVGHVGLFRYARIFQRANDPQPDIRVACLGDRDIPPDEAKPYLKPTRKVESEFSKEEIDKHLEERGAKYQGGGVKAFVSPQWTLEYDLALCELGAEMNQAVRLAAASKTRGGVLTPEQVTATVASAKEQMAAWRAAGKTSVEIAALIYEPLYRNAASKPETAQFLAGILRGKFSGEPHALQACLPDYIMSAIRHVTGK